MRMKIWTGLALGAAMAVPCSAQTVQVSGQNRTISITATEKVTAMADVATVHIGFIAYGPTKDAAYAAGSTVSNAVVDALVKAGVAKDAIESENQNIGPVQEYQIDKLSPQEKAQRQFQVNQSWTVRSNAADAAKVLDLAVKAGANQSGGIDWSLRDENALTAQAGAKALASARAQAAGMAQSLGAKIGALLYASNTVEAEPIRPVMRAMAMPAPMAQKVVQPLAINPRQIERSATVTAIFVVE